MSTIDFRIGGDVRPSRDVVNLRNRHLTELPKELFHLKGVKRLYLEGNELTRISRSIRKMKDLKWIYLHKNPLETCPDLSALTKLKSIILPVTIKSFPKLPEKTELRLY